MGHHRSRRSGHALHVTLDDLTTFDLRGDENGDDGGNDDGDGGGGASPASHNTTRTEAGDLDLSALDLLNPPRSRRKGQPPSRFPSPSVNQSTSLPFTQSQVLPQIEPPPSQSGSQSPSLPSTQSPVHPDTHPPSQSASQLPSLPSTQSPVHPQIQSPSSQSASQSSSHPPLSQSPTSSPSQTPDHRGVRGSEVPSRPLNYVPPKKGDRKPHSDGPLLPSSGLPSSTQTPDTSTPFLPSSSLLPSPPHPASPLSSGFLASLPSLPSPGQTSVPSLLTQKQPLTLVKGEREATTTATAITSRSPRSSSDQPPPPHTATPATATSLLKTTTTTTTTTTVKRETAHASLTPTTTAETHNHTTTTHTEPPAVPGNHTHKIATRTTDNQAITTAMPAPPTTHTNPPSSPTTPTTHTNPPTTPTTTRTPKTTTTTSSTTTTTTTNPRKTTKRRGPWASRTQRSAPSQRQVKESPPVTSDPSARDSDPSDPDGVCKDNPCGQEPSCFAKKDAPKGFLCFCDDRTTVEPLSQCKTRGELLSEHPSPKTLTIPREPVSMVGVVAVTSLVMVAMLLLGYWRRKSLCALVRHRHREKKSGQQSPDTIAKSHSLITDNFANNPNYYTPGPDTQMVHSLPVRPIHPEEISFIGELGEGCFGKVYKGTYTRLRKDIENEGEDPEGNENGGGGGGGGGGGRNDNRQGTENDGDSGGRGGGGGGRGEEEEKVCLTVAVKVIKESVSEKREEDFMREVEIMSAFSHPNILTLIGVVVKGSGGKPWMVFEYMPYGDLAELLRSCGPHFYSNHTPVASLSKEDLLHISVQIASGMEYLSLQHFVHRDLACRNCLVGENLTVKISDFGMSRDVYTCDYYKVGGSRLLPVRWMAPESIMYGKFTLESDVWSFGVVLWEIYSFGKQPYYGNSNENVVKLILQGILLSPPDTCPAQVCNVMRRCWATDPNDRLRFPEILEHLKELQVEGKASPHHDTSSLPPFLPPGPPIMYSQLCMQEEAESHLDKDLYLMPRKVEPREYLTIINEV